MKKTMDDLKKAIQNRDISLIREISLEKQRNGCATKVALSAQRYLWEEGGRIFPNSPMIKESGRGKTNLCHLSDER